MNTSNALSLSNGLDTTATAGAPDPHLGADLRLAARHLLQHPLTCAELHPDQFRLIRRHEHQLDRWFTQRLGYRLHVTADTARLFKTTATPHRRSLMTATTQPRPFRQSEYVMLCLILAAMAAGPAVASLKELVTKVRQAASDAGISVTEGPAERRALITALHWMIANGLASELHERVERYIDDAEADAIIRVAPERIAMLPLTALIGVADGDDDSGTEWNDQGAADLLARAERRDAGRQWMRARLVEDPVLYRHDLTSEEWGEFRRRLGVEGQWLDEMFGLVIEARAEGVAAIDPSGALSDKRFPTTGTVGHAGLILLGLLADVTQNATTGASTIGAATGDGSPDGSTRVPDYAEAVPVDAVVALMSEETARYRRYWSKLADEPEKLVKQALGPLVDHRLVAVDQDAAVRILPMGYRYAVTAKPAEGQAQLW